MFIAQVDEMDYSETGQAVNDINSLAEYVNSIIHKDQKVRPDTDDDTARYFHCAKVNFFFAQQVVSTKYNKNANFFKQQYPRLKAGQLPMIYRQIFSPPPEA
jgi:RecA-family ATPase